MKKSVKLSGVLALAGLTAMIVAPNMTHATGIGYETCSTYSCVSTVRQRANTFHLTKGVLKLTNDFITKVETKANSKYNGVNSPQGKMYQYRIYGVTSQKFLDVSLLLRNNDKFKKGIKNSDKLAKVCYDLAEIFKIKSEMANDSYKGGHYYFDKYFGDVWRNLLNAAKALKEKLDNPSTIKDSKYDDAKKFYDGNIDKVGDGTSNGAKIKEDEAKRLADDFKKYADALSSNDAFDALKNAAKALKDKLDSPSTIKDSKYDDAKKFYDGNIDKVGDGTSNGAKIKEDEAKRLADDFKKYADALSSNDAFDALKNAAKALKDKLDSPSTIKDSKYDDAKKFYDNNADKVRDNKLGADEAKRLADEFKKYADALSSNDALDALKNAADKLKDKLGHKNVIKDPKYDDAKRFYDNNADKARDNKLGADEAKRLADEFKKYADALNFADWLDDLREAAKELKSGLDNPKVKQDNAYDVGKRFYNDNIRKTDDTGLSKPAAQELAREFRALKDRLSFNSDGGDVNLSTSGDTVVAGDAIKDMFKWMKTANKDKTTVNSAFQKFFDGKKASGMYFDTEYTLGIGEGSNTVIPNRATRFDLSKLLNNNSLSFVTIGYRVENFDIVNSKYVKLYNSKIVGFREGWSDRATEAMQLINDYNKGWLESNDGYYGIAPFANKNTANEFIRQQKMDGSVVVQLGNSGKYMVVFKPGN